MPVAKINQFFRFRDKHTLETLRNVKIRNVTFDENTPLDEGYLYGGLNLWDLMHRDDIYFDYYMDGDVCVVRGVYRKKR